MAMLAEPRRRQRIGPNPRGKFFGEQENNFGKSLLQKMGWSSGEGLGLERQGISEAIKPKIQMSSKGLGYDPKANPWVEHNQEFEEILKGLNAESESIIPTNEKGEEIEEAGGDKKLETKSKQSRARIHYHKFVKGKDLSRASSDDMKSIFGSSNPDERLHFSEANTPELSAENPTSGGDGNGDGNVKEISGKEEGANVINRGSMVDYFKQKMDAKLQAATTVKVKTEVEDEDEGKIINGGSMVDYFKQKMEAKLQAATTVKVKTEVEDKDDENTINKGSMVDYFKQKMELKNRPAEVGNRNIKKKSKRNIEEALDAKIEDAVYGFIDQTLDSTVENIKKQSKRKHRDVETVEDDGTTIQDDSTVDSIKKKSKRKHQYAEIVEEDKEGTTIQEDSTVDNIKKKKRKHRDEQTVEEEGTTKEHSTVDNIMKKSKRKLRDAETAEEDKEDDGTTIQDDSTTDNIKKKSKRKRRNAETVEEDKEDDGTTIQDDSTADNIKKKSKRKRRNAETVEEDKEKEDEGITIQEDSTVDSIKKKKRKHRDAETVEEDQEDDGTTIQVDSTMDTMKRKKKVEKTNPEEMVEIGNVVDGAIEVESVVEMGSSLEEQLKMEMINLKNRKQRMNQQYLSSLGTVSKKFTKKGANMDKVKGYAVY